MPQRFLRPGLRTSDRWNALSWPAQSFFTRILTLVDDWGRYDGRVLILHGECFALRSEVTPQDTAGYRSELQAAGLINIYSVEGKEFIQVERWQERARGERSKYPDPVIPQDSAADGSGPQEKDASLAITPSPLHHRPSPLPEAKASGPAASGALAELTSAWNAAGLAQVVQISDGRRKAAKARLADPFWVSNYPAALERLAKSGFCRGQGPRGWKATFDFFVRPDTLPRILEGEFDDKPKPRLHPSTGQPLKGTGE